MKNEPVMEHIILNDLEPSPEPPVHSAHLALFMQKFVRDYFVENEEDDADMSVKSMLKPQITFSELGCPETVQVNMLLPTGQQHYLGTLQYTGTYGWIDIKVGTVVQAGMWPDEQAEPERMWPTKEIAGEYLRQMYFDGQDKMNADTVKDRDLPF